MAQELTLRGLVAQTVGANPFQAFGLALSINTPSPQHQSYHSIPQIRLQSGNQEGEAQYHLGLLLDVVTRVKGCLLGTGFPR